jgi:hypothetical protein
LNDCGIFCLRRIYMYTKFKRLLTVEEQKLLLLPTKLFRLFILWQIFEYYEDDLSNYIYNRQFIENMEDNYSRNIKIEKTLSPLQETNVVQQTPPKTINNIISKTSDTIIISKSNNKRFHDIKTMSIDTNILTNNINMETNNIQLKIDYDVEKNVNTITQMSPIMGNEQNDIERHSNYESPKQQQLDDVEIANDTICPTELTNNIHEKKNFFINTKDNAHTSSLALSPTKSPTYLLAQIDSDNLIPNENISESQTNSEMQINENNITEPSVEIPIEGNNPAIDNTDVDVIDKLMTNTKLDTVNASTTKPRKMPREASERKYLIKRKLPMTNQKQKHSNSKKSRDSEQIKNDRFVINPIEEFNYEEDSEIILNNIQSDIVDLYTENPYEFIDKKMNNLRKTNNMLQTQTIKQLREPEIFEEHLYSKYQKNSMAAKKIVNDMIQDNINEIEKIIAERKKIKINTKE